MQVIKPTPSQAAVVLKNFLKAEGVLMTLSKAQEAVARMQGFANWQSLAGAMDPRVGVPQGCLRQDDEFAYTMTSGEQTYAYISVNNLEVHIKHESEGVVIDVYPKVNPEEPLATTAAEFSDAEVDSTDYSEAESYGNFTLQQQLLLGRFVDVGNSRGVTPILNRNTELLKKFELHNEASGTLPSDRENDAVAFSYLGWSGVTRHVTIKDVLGAQAYGRDGWMLPDGLELHVYMTEKG